MIGWNSRQVIKNFAHKILFAKPKFRAFITTLVKPLDLVFTGFSENRAFWQWKLYFTDQIILLEHYLNHLYDLKGVNSSGEIVRYSIPNREFLIADKSIISIDDNTFLPANTVYHQIERAPGLTVYSNFEITQPNTIDEENLSLTPLLPIVRNTTFYQREYDVVNHFTVRIPSTMYYDLDSELEQKKRVSLEKEIREEISFYLKVGKQYIVEPYKDTV